MKPSHPPKQIGKILRSAPANLFTALAQLAPNWRWKIDGVSTAIVLAVLVLNKTPIKATAIGPWMNVVAIFSLGVVLRRNFWAKTNPKSGLATKLASRWGQRRG